ncbi:MAG: beta-galactosidase trimerization domain-containing protein, partial [Planctomycetes bacterium]|nr:beta-galactosidase trimerization domain-containing protein [Planctomycetota bacterium]
GEMDMSTYENIGEAFAYVEKIEDYGIGGIPVARLGLWRSFSQDHDEGLAKMLLEAHVNFDIANLEKDLEKYDVILVPGFACLNNAEADRLNAFARRGGKILVMGNGALNRKRDNTLLDIGASYLGKANYDRDYLVVGDTLNAGLVESPFLNYKPAIRVAAKPGTEVLAAIRNPYFSRTYGKFTSHQNTPYRLVDAKHPGILRNGNIIFIAHELDKMYYDHGARLHRDLFINTLKLVHTKPMVETQLPSAGRVSLLHQPEDSRYVVHLLYGPPIQRGRCEVIEDLPVLYNVPVSVNLPEKVKKAVLVPDMQELAISEKDGKLSVTVPKFQCHCAVVFEY